MNTFIKHAIYLIIVILLITNTVFAQIDFEEYAKQQRKEFTEYVQKSKTDFKNYRDSLNQAYADYLAKEWKDFDLQKPEPLIKKPIATPPVYDNTALKPQPEETPVLKPEEPKPIPNHIPIPTPVPEPKNIPIPKPEPKPIVKPELKSTPAPTPQKVNKAVFFGTDITLKEISVSPAGLSNADEQEVAQYWKKLSAMPYMEIVTEVQRIKTDLQLNDWGVYQLLGETFASYFPRGSANEKVVFTVFMLNQMGYRAKIGKTQNELLPLVAFQQPVSNVPFIIYGNNTSVKYSVLNTSRKTLPKIQTCAMDYAEALANMDLSVPDYPFLNDKIATKVLTVGKESYTFKYNQNIVDFYRNYPRVSFSVYAEAALDPVLLQSATEQLMPFIANKPQEEAVNFLLHFVQKAFQYKTDGEQFGYEKWNFAEETIASAYSDCEDRSILFAQLVRKLLNMPVVLVYYPGEHLATAVKFKNDATTGDYLMVNGEKYLICDPTYINANIGMSMPQFANNQVEIFELKK